MILVEKWKFYLSLFLDKIGLEKVFWDLWGRKQALLDCKNMTFHRHHIGFFSKGVTHDFGQNMEILSLYVFVQMVLEIMFDDHWGRKQALFDYKNLAITKSPYWDFFKGVNPRFWLKIGNYLFVCFLAK